MARNSSKMWNYNSLKKTFLSTLVNCEENSTLNEKTSNKQSIMKEESEKPKQTLNFQSLLNRKIIISAKLR